MFALNAAFSGMKSVALSLAIVNVLVLASVLICLFFAYRIKNADSRPEPKQKRTFFDSPAPKNDANVQNSKEK